MDGNFVIDKVELGSVAIDEVEHVDQAPQTVTSTKQVPLLHLFNLRIELDLMRHVADHASLPTKPFSTPIVFSATRNRQAQGNMGDLSLLVTAPISTSIYSQMRFLSLNAWDLQHPICVAWAQRTSGRNVTKLVLRGQASLLDALVQLEGQGLVKLDSTLSLQGRSNGSGGDGDHLLVQVRLTEQWYQATYATPAKQLVIHALFPAHSRTNDLESEAMDREGSVTSVDTFYAALQRAPKTKDGLIVQDQKLDDSMQETEEERAVHERRIAKGKGRAIDVDDDCPNGWSPEEEDELLTPRGLNATLMQFQSRSVRWLLRREGVYVPPRSVTYRSRAEVLTNGDGDHMHVDRVDDEELEKDLGTIAPLPMDQLRQVARSPLWCKCRLPGVAQDLWVNRINSSIVVEDPALSRIVDDTLPAVAHPNGATASGATISGPSLALGSGLLAEEVGLGKTVEVISLILMHRRMERNLLPHYHDPATETDVYPSSLSLIICPPVLTGQWVKELERHAPSLRVLRYEGINKVPVNKTVKDVIRSHDIILTTYDVLRREINVARKPHQRSLRSGPQGRPKYRRSLLVQIEFLRIILDEAQMLGDTALTASETAGLLPRLFSFAVTSTPLRARLDDLQGLLTFLKIDPFGPGSSKGYLARLLEEKETFKTLWNEIGTRTMKAQVEKELVIPPQERFVVPCDFSAVEAYYYNTRYSEMLESLQLDLDGTLKDPTTPWDPDASDLSRWLVSLRQLAIHPQVGIQNKRGLGHVLKSVDEVLTTMRANTVSALHTDQRVLLHARMTRAQYGMYDAEDCERFEKSLLLFDHVVRDLEPVTKEVIEQLRQAWMDRPKAAAVGLTAGSVAIPEDRQSEEEEAVDDEVAEALGLGLEDEYDSSDDDGDELAYQDHNTGLVKLRAKTDKEKLAIKTLGSLRSRLRDLLFVKHSAWFFSGNAYFNMGKFAVQEAEMYQKAEELRSSILRPWEKQVERATARLQRQIEARVDLKVEDLEVKFAKVGPGISAQNAFEEIAVTTDIINGWAELIWEWRAIILKLMERRVSVAGQDATGEEYAQRAEDQEKADCYLEQYTIILEQWRSAITGERSALGDQLELEIAGKQNRNRKIESQGANRAKRVKVRQFVPIKDRRVPTLEQGDTLRDILTFELTVERLQAKGDGMEAHEVVGLKRMIGRLKDTRDAEYVSAKERELLIIDIDRLTAAIKPKEKVADRLRLELGEITRAMNVRIRYFTQLQALSDAVADPDTYRRGWRGYLSEMEALREQELKVEAEIRLKLASRRYLDSLNETSGLKADVNETTCVICSEPYTRGALPADMKVLTTCAHVFCAVCFARWRTRSRQCAVCKRDLSPGQWQTVHYRSKVVEQPAAKPNGEHANGTVAPKKRAIDQVTEDDDAALDTLNKVDSFDAIKDLRSIPHELAQAIEAVDTYQPLSTKSDLLVKHVKYIRNENPNAKVVVFSAWQESLMILMQAFVRNGIEFVSIDSNKGKKEALVKRFVEDPHIAAFFLVSCSRPRNPVVTLLTLQAACGQQNTKSQSAGLTLTCARYVFLVEPVLHPSLEIQAVARVHRIGQTARTAVYQYYVSDSVDQRVAELRGRQGTSLFLKSSHSNSAAKESKLNQKDLSTRGTNSTKNVDESVEDQDDLIRCLFAPEHYLNLQRSLLPPQLRNDADRAAPVADDAEIKRMSISAQGRAGQAALKRARMIDPLVNGGEDE
ncbi:BZ3500_MvSof-1268-A1-R1_Chr2-2g04758 [Microbotryum saponariae]|uniref:BZ3500_MvSof-1268-A1-R1_Chr2-2g04758 protein n=1 Tax=Microbotryum saponariae TaxID=289078 RepID=A0A2X0K3V3_9BASI|nr:BZ3500_MvSof-1268-A1-R1_Chr2-2g04758 [Microbotryum saponariae]SDA00092.1 BZ3501_MvSof-1269-A2-R1_Chr2-2g04432 [Microbotryum saponariae]